MIRRSAASSRLSALRPSGVIETQVRWRCPSGSRVESDQPGGLEDLEVPAEVAVGDRQLPFEVGEVGPRQYDEGGEDAEPDTLVHVVVELVDRVLAHRLVLDACHSRRP